MKKTIITTAVLIVVLILTSDVYAQAGFGMPGQPRNPNPVINEEGEFVAPENEEKNKNQINTQNQGLEKQLEINARNQEAPNYGLNNARNRMSETARSVQDLLSTIDSSEGIGREISIIARQQQDAQAEIVQVLDKIESRKGFLRQVLGPDYAALKEMESIIYKNQNRIQQLEMLKSNLQNQSEGNNLQQTIQKMIDQNEALQDQVQFEKDKPGMFGWLIKMFN